MTLFQIQFLNAVGDLLDLIPSVSPTKNSSLKVFKRWDMGHCSALIKVRHIAAFLFFLALGHADFFCVNPSVATSQPWLKPSISSWFLCLEVKNWKELMEGIGSTWCYLCFFHHSSHAICTYHSHLPQSSILDTWKTESVCLVHTKG